MYTFNTIKSCINLYIKLEKDGIIGKKRIDYIKSIFNVHINTLYKWINKYHNKKSISSNNNKYTNNYKLNNLKVTKDIEKLIIQSIDKNNNFDTKKIIKNILDKFNVLLSRSTIYSILHKNNFTYKKLIIKNVPYDNDKIKNLKNELNIKINNIDETTLVSYDEMSIYLNAKQYKGWSLKGNKCIIETKNKSIFNKRFSIGMSVSINGDIDFTITYGALNSFKFNTFMEKINKNNCSILLDNASIHKNKHFNNNIKINNWNIIYNVPYHSHLNPIEYIFSLLRRELLKNDINSFNDIIETVIKFKKNINKTYVKNIFNKCLNEIKQIIN